MVIPLTLTCSKISLAYVNKHTGLITIRPWSISINQEFYNQENFKVDSSLDSGSGVRTAHLW